jgi:hypothetical protein
MLLCEPEVNEGFFIFPLFDLFSNYPKDFFILPNIFSVMLPYLSTANYAGKGE